MEDIQPIPFIKNFLLKYVDEAALQRRQSQAAEDDNPPSPMTIGGSGEESTAGLKFHAPHTPPSNPLTPASPHGILQSPPAPSIRQPSPAPSSNMPHPSPNPQGQPTPSPGGIMSPAIPSLGSPFPSAASPMAVGSPGMPRPSPRPLQSPHSVQSQSGQGSQHSKNQAPSSRLLPQRLWAGATPTPLTAEALDDICRPSPAPPTPNGHTPPLGPSLNLSPLHR